MGARDYLSEIRDKRVARESKMSNVGRVRNVIKNEKLSNLEKLNIVKTQADKIEQDALNRERQRAADQRLRALAEDQDDALKRKDRIQHDFEQVDEVNQLMLDAIKAKLAILDHQNADVERGEQGAAAGGGDEKLMAEDFLY